MPQRPAQSAARRRLETQREQIEALAPGAIVSAIRPAGEDAGRFTIRVGRVRFGPVHADDIETIGLRLGAPIDTPALARLAEALAREAARADALRLLRTRARAKQDLVSRLVRKGHDRSAAVSAAERLERVGLIDDEALARDRAGQLADNARLGPRAAQGRLRSQGLAAATSSRAVEEAFAGLDLRERALEAARRRLRTMSARLDAETRERRLYGFLARRGYDHEICRSAVREAMTEPAES